MEQKQRPSSRSQPGDSHGFNLNELDKNYQQRKASIDASTDRTLGNIDDILNENSQVDSADNQPSDTVSPHSTDQTPPGSSGRQPTMEPPKSSHTSTRQQLKPLSSNVGGGVTSSASATNSGDKAPGLASAAVAKPAAQPSTSLAKRLGSSLQAARRSISGNKRKAGITGGIIAIVVASVGGIFSLLPSINLDSMMNGASKYAFKRVTHSYSSRQMVVIKMYMRDRFTPGILRDGSIKNYDNSVFSQLYSKLRDSDLEKRLDAAGYKITYENNDPQNKILRIQHTGDPDITASNFDQSFNTVFQKSAARARIGQIYDELYRDAGFFKRLSVKARLGRLTGTKWHWLDPINQPLAKARQTALNQATIYILDKVPFSQTAAIKMLGLITGERIDTPTAQAALAESNAELKAAAEVGELTEDAISKVFLKTLAPKVVTMAADVSNPVGWVLGFIAVGCAWNDLVTNGYDDVSQLVKDKANAEYMIYYTMMVSKQSQLHDGSTNGTAVDATMNMLVDKNGRDWSQTNNARRANGENIPYERSTDCTKATELCDAKRPRTILSSSAVGNFIGNGLYGTKQLSETELRYLPGTPGSIITGGLCGAIIPVIDGVFGAATYLLEQSIGLAIAALPNKQEIRAFNDDVSQKGSAYISERLLMPMLNHLAAPVANADTRGPFLYNAVLAGGVGASNMYIRDHCGDTSNQGDFAAAQKCMLNDQQAIALERSSNQDTMASLALLSPWQRLTTREYGGSFANRIIAKIPMTPRVAMNRVTQYIGGFYTMPSGRHIASVGDSFMRTITYKSSAITVTFPEQPVGQDPYGYPEECLQSAPLNADAETSGCVDQFGNKLAIDSFDTTVACSMLAGTVKSSEMPDECNEDTAGQAAPGAPAAPATPTDAIDPATLYTDSSAIACDSRTQDLGIQDGYRNNNVVKIRICGLPNLTSSSQESRVGTRLYIPNANGKCIVNSRLSTVWYNLAAAATSAGVAISGTSCFRTMAHQTSLWNANPNPSAVARPGTSNHQMGIAIDFNVLSKTDHSGPVWTWLDANAATYGIKNYPAEAWHWSPTGN